MRRLAKDVTGGLTLIAAVLAGQAAEQASAGSFDDALGVKKPGVVVQSGTPGGAASASRTSWAATSPTHLATDTQDACVDAVEIDERLLAEGLIHSELEGPIGPDDPSVTGTFRPRSRVTATPVSAKTAAAVVGTGVDDTASRIAETSEPALITDRVEEAEAIPSSGNWMNNVTSAVSRFWRRAF